MSYVIDYFDDTPPIFTTLDKHGEQKTISINELSLIKTPIITYDFWIIIDYFRANDLDLPPNIVDVVTAKRLLTGKPKSCFNDSKPWEYWEQIRSYLDTEIYENLKLISFHKTERPSTDEIQSLLNEMNISLSELWNDLHSDLEIKNEIKRFFEIEIPVYNIMLNTQKDGIKVDEEKLDEHLATSNKIYYKAKKNIEIKYSINIEDKNIISQFISVKNAYRSNINKPDLNIHNYREFIKINSNHDEISNNFNNYHRYKLERSILSKITPLDSKVYPVFDICGTITGRILSIDPLLQNLKKTHRDIIIPDDNKRLIYMDYSQFEPGIMASLANDEYFIEKYNNNDIYTELSELIFNTQNERKTAKIIFLSYSYGMSWNNIKKLIYTLNSDINNNENFDIKKIYNFLSVFETWKEKAYKTLLEENRVGTILGNYRYRESSNDLSNREKRFSVSQLVQGTASLILKNVIIEIHERLPNVQISLPMHDALLMQIDIDTHHSVDNELEEIFKKNFKEICPQITPQVTTDVF